MLAVYRYYVRLLWWAEYIADLLAWTVMRAEHIPAMDVCKGRKSLLFCEVFFDIFSGCFTYHGCNLFQ